MLVTYRYKLRLRSGQYARMAQLCEMQRQLYNAALEERIGAWSRARHSVTRLDQQKSLTEIRQADPEGHGSLPVNMGRWTLKRVEDAMTGFFSRVKRGQKAGFPRFKGRHRWSSFGMLEVSGMQLRGQFLILKGMDRAIRLNMHRPLPADAKIKGATFTLHGRHWFVSLQVESTEIVAAEAPTGPAIGLDVGVEHLATWSDGAVDGHIPNVRPRSRREHELRCAQRALARCRRGSRRRAKVRERLARLHRAIGNARDTHLHQQAERLARSHKLIVIERLQVRNMVRSAAGTVAEPGTNVRAKSGLNRSILDASMAKFLQYLRYKAERAGSAVLEVRAAGTSQLCSGCGTKVPKSLSVRRHSCACGLELQRDVNAARVILLRGLPAEGVQPLGQPNVADHGVRAAGTLLAA